MVSGGDDRAGDSRALIDRALVELCAENTYANVTLPMVLARAGVDLATFEGFYVDLEDCFCRIYAEMRDEFMMSVGAAFAAGETWRDGIRAAAYAMLVFLREDQIRGRMSFVEVLYAGDRAKLIRGETMQVLFALIDQGRNEPGASSATSRFTAEAIGSSIYQKIQMVVQNEELDEFESIVRELMYAVVLPYLGEEAAREELEISPPEWAK